MSFLDNYEDVNARIKRFRLEHPSGRFYRGYGHYGKCGTRDR